MWSYRTKSQISCRHSWHCLLLAADQGTKGGISPSCRPWQNGVTTEVYTLQRIAPILNAGCYFEAFYPTSGMLVTLVWWCVTYWNILTNSPRKRLVSWSRTSKLWSARNQFVFACVSVPVYPCMCIVCVRHCITWSQFGNDSVQVCLHKCHCQHYAFCLWMHSSTAC